MRIELSPQPIQIQLDRSQSQISEDAELPPSRVVGGLVVPYGVPGIVRVNGEPRRVTFAADSVDVPEHVPMILAHNLDRPIGVLVTHASGEAGLSGVFAIDATPDGDTAIAQARSGSRRGLSGGIDVDPDGVTETDDGGLTVTASRLAEVSQVVLGAYDGAAITQIAAQQTPQAEGSEMPDDVQPAQPALAPITTPDDAPPVAERRPVIVTAERDQPEMRLGEYVQTLVRAERGDRVARGRIEAQLSRGDLTTSPGVVPIVYVQTIIDSLGFDRPLFDAMDHAEMPAAGMTIRRPVITNRPDGGWLANDQAGAPTSPVAIGDHDEAVRQWAWGGSASVALVERSSPSYIEEVFSQAVKAYYRDVEADIAAEFPAATGGPATLGAAVAAYLAAYRSYPTLLVCGAQAYGSLLDATGVLMFTSGSATAAGGGTVAGLRAVASPDVAPADAWVTAGDFIECRESTPIRLSVSDVTSLSLEIGVTAFFASTQTRAAIGGVNGAVGIPGFTGGALAQPAKRESK